VTGASHDLRVVDQDLVGPVNLLQPYLHALLRRSRQVLADVIGLDRQLAMPAIDEDDELNGARAAEMISASSAARIVRPVYSTSSTSSIRLLSIENGTSVRRTTGCGPTGCRIRSSR